MTKSRTNRNARKTDSRPAAATLIETEVPAAVMVDAAVVKTGTPSTQKAPTKLGAVVAMLRRDGGATVAEMMEATSWQAHSVRGFLSGTVKKKLGLELNKTTAADGQLTYSIVSSAESTTPAQNAPHDNPETSNPVETDTAVAAGAEPPSEVASPAADLEQGDDRDTALRREKASQTDPVTSDDEA